MMQDFLKKAGWGDAQITHITPDWSPRQYWRLTRSNGETAIFLQGPAQDFRGHGLKDFVDIGIHLARLGLSVPAIYVQDLANARLLMEDFGNTPIDTPTVETPAYETAIDVLAVLRTDKQLDALLPRYEDGYIFKKTDLFATQYARGDLDSWTAAWTEVTDALPACHYVPAHMDYKAGNLHWLPDRNGVKRIGILDYQAAHSAPFVYDCVTLLEDARRMLDPALKTHLKNRFRTNLPDGWQPLFDLWYPVIAVQFHTGVLGQISNNPKIPQDMPKRLEAYLREELQAPVFAPVRKWCATHNALI